MSNPLEHRHLLRDVKTALEVSIAARAPWPLVEQLAMCAGLLDALEVIPASTILPETIERARVTLNSYRLWEKDGAHKGEA